MTRVKLLKKKETEMKSRAVKAVSRNPAEYMRLNTATDHISPAAGVGELP